jgi:hypothetical protein
MLLLSFTPNTQACPSLQFIQLNQLGIEGAVNFGLLRPAVLLLTFFPHQSLNCFKDPLAFSFAKYDIF